MENDFTAGEKIKQALLADAVCDCGCEGLGYGYMWGGRTCYICKQAPATETDHVKPLSQGGLHCSKNFASACQSCAAAKGEHVWPGQPGWPAFMLQRRQAAQ